MRLARIICTSLIASCIILTLSRCSDNVDDSNLYVFTGDMISTYLTKNSDQFSDYIALAQRTKLSRRSQSTVMELLATRGHYTVFAPTNDAVHAFVDSIMDQKDYPLSDVSDSIAEMIVKNSIIDTGTADAYETNDLTEGALAYQNLNNRYVTVSFDTINEYQC